MIPIVCIVGKSDSGKTTVMERLLPVLTRRGYRVATVKHDVHGFEMDREGKDSWRHKQAGAYAVVVSSGARIGMIEDLARERTLDEIRVRYVPDVDLILTEGYKRSRFPKVEVSLFNPDRDLLCTKEDRLIAVVTPRSVSADVPVFVLEQMEELADLLEQRFLGKRPGRTAEVFLDGTPLPLNPFVQEVLRKVVRAVLSTLKGWAPDAAVEIRLAGGGPGPTSTRDHGGQHEPDTGSGRVPD